MPTFLSGVKDRLVPKGERPCTIRTGAFAGLKMALDLKHQTQFWLGLAERELNGWLRQFAAPARTALDVGASEGVYTLYFLSRPNIRHVLAFDAGEHFPGKLERNLGLNDLPSGNRLTLIKARVTNRDGGGEVRLDSAAGHLAGPGVVKIDVEGAELQVLEGAAALLGRRDFSWIVETHSADLERRCEAVLRSAGLRTRIVDKAWWRLFVPELRPLAHNRWLVAWRQER